MTLDKSVSVPPCPICAMGKNSTVLVLRGVVWINTVELVRCSGSTVIGAVEVPWSARMAQYSVGRAPCCQPLSPESTVRAAVT